MKALVQIQTDRTFTFRRDLQGLRAVAILLVVLGHAGLDVLQGGFIGVDLFFVLSGYLITALLLCELERSGHLAFMPFYARRLKRLLPALIFMLTLSSALAISLLSGVEASAQLASSPYAATWTSNLYFVFTTVDYFDELASLDLFLHTWSLGVEEQFYLVWPIVLLLLFRIGGSKWGANQHGRRLMLSGLGIVFVATLALSLYWTVTMPQAAFYLMPSRIWQFSLGAIVYLLLRNDPLDGSRLADCCSQLPANAMLGMGLILITGSAIVFDSGHAYPGFWAVIPSLGAALVIMAGHTLPQGQSSLLAHPVLVWLGDRSYSLYLWHWPIFMLGFSMGFKGQWFPTLGMLLLVLLVSALSFKFIELPFWKGRWSHAKPAHILWVAVVVMSTVALVMNYGLRQLPQSDITTVKGNQWRNDKPEIYRIPCDAWYTHALVQPCMGGNRAGKKTVVLLGDSIGAQWFSMIPELFTKPLWRIIVLTKSSCPMVDEDYYYPRIRRIYQVCTDWRNAVLETLERIKPDVLIMGSAATYDYSETEWIEGSSRVFERASKAATTVFVIPGTPSLDFDGPGCISRHLSPEGDVDRTACLAKGRLKHVQLVAGFLGQAADKFPNVHMLDLNDLVCPGRSCNAISEAGVVVFRDIQHLTDSFVRAQIPFIRERLNKVLPPVRSQK